MTYCSHSNPYCSSSSGTRSGRHLCVLVSTIEEIEAAEAVGVEIAGVDLMSVENWPYVIEANASPSFRGSLEATGTNAA